MTSPRREALDDLRHFVATELITAGIDVRTVANRLGHARTSTTLDIYWACVPAQDQHAAHYLEAVLSHLKLCAPTSCGSNGWATGTAG